VATPYQAEILKFEEKILVYSPEGRHKNATRKKKHNKQKHKPKTKHSNKRPNQNKRDKYQFMSQIMQEVITLYHPNLVWQKKQTEEQKHHQTIPEGERSNKRTMRKPGIPPARIPEITWHQPTRHNKSPMVTSKQTTTTPRRNESGEKIR